MNETTYTVFQDCPDYAMLNTSNNWEILEVHGTDSIPHCTVEQCHVDIMGLTVCNASTINEIIVG